MGMPGGTELIVILLIVVLLFGAKKIPELASGLGKGIKNFKGAMNEDEEKVDSKENEKITKNDETEKAAETTNSETTTKA